MNAINENLQSIPSNLFSRFARFVEEEVGVSTSSTIQDLVETTRKDRLNEFSIWSYSELDEIEEESGLYARDTLLADLIVLRDARHATETA